VELSNQLKVSWAAVTAAGELRTVKSVNRKDRKNSLWNDFS
jgi:hypothetical protein